MLNKQNNMTYCSSPLSEGRNMKQLTITEMIGIAKTTCHINENGIDCIYCKNFKNCPLERKYGKKVMFEITSAFNNPLTNWER